MPTVHLDDLCGVTADDDRNRVYRIADTDDDAPKILTILADCADFITHWRAVDRGVLVHCTSGISRSPTLIFLYLVQRGEVQSVRQFQDLYHAWNPNDGFKHLFWEMNL
jgi:protein-tyrosine phosphatase